MIKPDYDGGSLVNLMASLARGLGAHSTTYKNAELLPSKTIAGARQVVLLLIDGLGYRYLQRRGSVLADYLSGSLTSVFPSSTAPAITTLMTGLAPQQHAVTGWYMWLKELGSVIMPLPFQARWGGSAFADCGVKPTMLLPCSLFDAVNAECHYLIPRRLVDSAYSRTAAGTARRTAYRDLDEFFQLIAVLVQRDLHRKQSHRYLYAYWPQFDALSHQYGVDSPAVSDHLAAIEGRFLALLHELRGSDTLVILTADHGFINTAPAVTVRVPEHPELADCLSLPLCGEPRVAYAYVRSERRAHFERYVSEHLSAFCELYTATDFVDSGWFGHGEPDPRLWQRIGDYVLLAKGRCVFKDTLAGEGYSSEIGVHGGASEDEMYVPLITAYC